MPKKSLSIDLLMLMACLMIARFSCIVLSNFPLMSIKFIFIYGIIFLGIFLIRKSNIVTKREFICLISLMAYILFVFVKTVIDTGNIFNTEAFNSYVLLFLFLIYLYMKQVKETERKKFFLIAIIGFEFTYVYSIKWLAVDPNLSRKAAANIVTQGVDNLNAIGGFDTVYGSILIIIVLLFIVKGLNEKWKKFLCSLVIISASIFVIMASYGTALVLLIIALGLWVIKTNKVIGGIIIVMVITVAINHEQMGQTLSVWSQKIEFSDTLAQKVDEMGMILRTGEATGTLAGDEGRLARMGWSLEAFAKYPLFGGYGKEGVAIGYHSELTDTLGKFGIVGFGLILVFFVSFFKDIYYNLQSKEGKQCCVLVGVMYVAIAMLNPALYTQQVLPLFILLPTIDIFINQNREKGKKYEKNTYFSPLQ